MKVAVLLWLSVLVLSLLSTNANHLFTTASEPVLDTDGEPLRVGVDYNILSVIRGAGGGGVTLGLNRNGKLCPLDVVQERSDLLPGLPVTFSPVYTKEGLIGLGVYLKIEFSVGATICMQSTVWRLGDADDILGGSFVTTGGSEHPDSGITARFSIVKSGEDYKFRVCWPPTKIACSDVGVFVDDKGVRRLALSPKPLIVKFKKA